MNDVELEPNQKVKKIIESYFSDDKLPYDYDILRYMDNAGWIALHFVLKKPRINSLLSKLASNQRDKIQICVLSLKSSKELALRKLGCITGYYIKRTRELSPELSEKAEDTCEKKGPSLRDESEDDYKEEDRRPDKYRNDEKPAKSKKISQEYEEDYEEEGDSKESKQRRTDHYQNERPPPRSKFHNKSQEYEEDYEEEEDSNEPKQRRTDHYKNERPPPRSKFHNKEYLDDEDDEEREEDPKESIQRRTENYQNERPPLRNKFHNKEPKRTSKDDEDEDDYEESDRKYHQQSKRFEDKPRKYSDDNYNENGRKRYDQRDRYDNQPRKGLYQYDDNNNSRKDEQYSKYQDKYRKPNVRDYGGNGYGGSKDRFNKERERDSYNQNDRDRFNRDRDRDGCRSKGYNDGDSNRTTSNYNRGYDGRNYQQRRDSEDRENKKPNFGRGQGGGMRRSHSNSR